MTKVFWVGAASGALLVGSAFGAAWYAASKPKCLLARALDGACHVAVKLAPVEGLSRTVDRLEASRTLARGETDISAGLPEEPVADQEPAPAAPGTSLKSNVGDPQPSIVIPEDTPRETAPAFPPQTATPVAPQAPGAPAVMPRCEEDDTVLPMPTLLEEEPVSCWMKAVVEKLAGFVSSPVPGGEELAEPMEVTEMPQAVEPECREDPHRDHQYSGCPYTGRGCSPCPRHPRQESSALEMIRKLRHREAVDPMPTNPQLDTLELRPSDRKPTETRPDNL